MTSQNRPSRHARAGTFAGAAVLLLVAFGGYLVWTGKILRGKPLCEVCKRELHPANAFMLVSADGSRRQTCCPRCGLRYILDHGGRAVSATNFSTKKQISAESAIYLEGSDIMECCTGTGFRSDEASYQDVEYDRCMPSLLAFSSRDEAELARRDHGGQIISFEEARQSVQRQLAR